MDDNYKKVKDHPDLAKDANVPGVVINRNKNAYEKAVKRARSAQAKQQEEEEQRDRIRSTTREINTLKSEIHEIKNLLQQLVDK